MAKKRRKKSSKCPEPFNTLIDIAAGITMNAVANKMEEKHHYRKRGVPNPYRASAIGMSMGKLNKTEDVIKLGGFLGAMGSFDPDDTESGHHSLHSSSIGYHADELWEFDNMNVSPTTNSNKYAWRMNCEDGSAYGIYPEDYETRQAYNLALSNAKNTVVSLESDLNSSKEITEASDVVTQEKYTYCKISRIDNGKNDYFFLGGLDLRVGDFVVVPTDAGQSKAIVIQISSYTVDEVPKPIGKTKEIIEKCFN